MVEEISKRFSMLEFDNPYTEPKLPDVSSISNRVRSLDIDHLDGPLVEVEEETETVNRISRPAEPIITMPVMRLSVPCAAGAASVGMLELIIIGY